MKLYPTCVPTTVWLVFLAMAAAMVPLLESAALADGIDVVGPAGSHAILIVPDRPIPAEEYAAQEIQYHVRQSTGVELPIVKESARPVGDDDAPAAICIGNTEALHRAGLDERVRALPPNACLIKLCGQTLFIAGRDTDGPLWSNQWTIHEVRTHMGTLFGAYELLEKQLGVKWLWPGETGQVIPRHESIHVEQWDQTWTPPLIHSRLRDGTSMQIDHAAESGANGVKIWSSAEAAARYRRDQGIWLRRQRFAMSGNMDVRHSFTTYWQEFGKSHPEFFNLLPDGTRRSDPTVYGGSPDHVSMCVSNAELQKQIVQNWLATRSPDNPFLGVGENDNPGKCTCANCLAWDAPADPKHPVASDRRLRLARQAFAKNDPQWYRRLGSLSDRYARFYLALQKLAQQSVPDAIVVSLAYENYVSAPVETKLNDRIVIAFVPGFSFPWTEQKRADFRRQLEGWFDAGASMMLRPNYFLDGHNMPVFFARKFGDDFQHAANHRLIATDFDSLTGQWAAQGPNLYVLARVHVDPQRPIDEVLDEYYAGFGPAADAVKQYFAHWEGVSDAVSDAAFDRAASETQGNSWWGFVRLADRIFTPEVMRRGRQLLDDARRAAQGDHTAVARVDFLEKGLRNAELTLDAQRAFRAYQKSGDIAPFRQAVIELDQYRNSIDGADTSNLTFTYWAETLSGWDRKAVYQ